MKKSTSYNHFLDKVAGGAMPEFNYSKPPLERYRLIWVNKLYKSIDAYDEVKSF